MNKLQENLSPIQRRSETLKKNKKLVIVALGFAIVLLSIMILYAGYIFGKAIL